VQIVGYINTGKINISKLPCSRPAAESITRSVTVVFCELGCETDNSLLLTAES